jgi:hypothetical protein
VRWTVRPDGTFASVTTISGSAGTPPGSGVLPEPAIADPIAETTITATAAVANLAKVSMSGDLRGARMNARRCGVVSVVARATSSTRSGARSGATFM